MELKIDSSAWLASEREEKGKDEREKREKIGRAHFDFSPFLRPAKEAIN